MCKPILRVVSLLLLGVWGFAAAAAVYAAVKGGRAVPQDPAADEVDLVTTFGPSEFASTAGTFRGGSMTTMFGGSVLDLRGATLDPAGARLHVTTMFGGGNLVVPEGWIVDSRILACFGGLGDARATVDRGPDAPTLRLDGLVLFGGWGITSEPAGRNELEGASA